jgi:hypothetical protein
LRETRRDRANSSPSFIKLHRQLYAQRRFRPIPAETLIIGY